MISLENRTNITDFSQVPAQDIEKEVQEYETTLQEIAHRPLNLNFGAVRRELAEEQNREVAKAAPKVVADLIEKDPENIQKFYEAYRGMNSMSDTTNSLEIQAGTEAVIDAYYENPELFEKWKAAGKDLLKTQSDRAANELYTYKTLSQGRKAAQERTGLEELLDVFIDATIWAGTKTTSLVNISLDNVSGTKDTISSALLRRPYISTRVMYEKMREIVKEKQRTLPPAEFKTWLDNAFVNNIEGKSYLFKRHPLSDRTDYEILNAIISKDSPSAESLVTTDDIGQSLKTWNAVRKGEVKLPGAETFDKIKKGTVGIPNIFKRNKTTSASGEKLRDILTEEVEKTAHNSYRRKKRATKKIEEGDLNTTVDESMPSVFSPLPNKPVPMLYNSPQAYIAQHRGLPTITDTRPQIAMSLDDTDVIYTMPVDETIVDIRPFINEYGDTVYRTVPKDKSHKQIEAEDRKAITANEFEKLDVEKRTAIEAEKRPVIEDFRDFDVYEDTGFEIIYGPGYNPEEGYATFHEALQDALRRRVRDMEADGVHEIQQASRQYYRGTPDLKYIGTGERGAAYGPGAYLSEFDKKYGRSTPANNYYLKDVHNSKDYIDFTKSRSDKVFRHEVKLPEDTDQYIKEVEKNVKAFLIDEESVKNPIRDAENFSFYVNNQFLKSSVTDDLADKYNEIDHLFYILRKPKLVNGKVEYAIDHDTFVDFVDHLVSIDYYLAFRDLTQSFLDSGGLTIKKTYDTLYRKGNKADQKILTDLKPFFMDASNFSQGTLKTFSMPDEVRNKLLDERAGEIKDLAASLKYDKSIGELIEELYKKDNSYTALANLYTKVAGYSGKISIENFEKLLKEGGHNGSDYKMFDDSYVKVSSLAAKLNDYNVPRTIDWLKEHNIYGSIHAKQNMVLNAPEYLRSEWARQLYKTNLTQPQGTWRYKYTIENPQYFYYPKKIGDKWFVAHRNGDKGFQITFDEDDMVTYEGAENF